MAELPPAELRRAELPPAEPRRLLAVAAVVTALVAGACTAPIRNSAAPRCTKTDTLALLAQSVPSAELLPCIAVIPAGWSFGDMDIGSGEATFTLDSDRAGLSAVRVTLAAGCNTENATELRSEEAQTRQFERVESIVGQHRGLRSYVFPGGCVTYRYRFGDNASALLADVSLALTFVTRDDVDEAVRRSSGGRVHL